MQRNRRVRSTVSIPEDLESAQAKLVYFCLQTREGATADELCSLLGIEKGGVLSILSTLRERGHVERVENRYTVVR